MAKRKLFTETVKYFKKIKDRWYIEFKGESAYLCDGYMICKMPIPYYMEYIVSSIAGIPTHTGDGRYTIENGRTHEGNIDLATMIEQTEVYGQTTATNMLIDCADHKWKARQARVFLWDINGETSGAMINETFYQISKEYSPDGKYGYSRKNAPLITGNEDFSCLVLPIHYASDSMLQTIIDAMNNARTAEKIA